MTRELIIAVVTCVATVISTVIAVLSYLNNKNEQIIKAALSPNTQAALKPNMWRRSNKLWSFLLFKYSTR